MFDGVDIVDQDGEIVVKDTLKETETVYFKCEDGFELIGPKETSCKNDGSVDVGDDEKPSCEGYLSYVLHILFHILFLTITRR